jgi:hypothetical protein
MSSCSDVILAIACLFVGARNKLVRWSFCRLAFPGNHVAKQLLCCGYLTRKSMVTFAFCLVAVRADTDPDFRASI